MSPRTPQQFKKIREEKMTLIMDVALEHFATKGYFKTTISHIARHAKISKGLMYNYFENKEALLHSIIHKSVHEVYKYLDINRDGHLSEEEFEFFIRKINVLLKEKRHFWQLMLQLLMQNDVRTQFIKALQESDYLTYPGHDHGDNFYPSQVQKMFKEYFYAKKKEKDKSFDPDCELEMFVNSLMGYAIKTIYSEGADNEYNAKTINKIIELYK